MRLLLVEEDHELRMELGTTLIIEEGYALDTAVNEVEGLMKALTRNYDAIILDLALRNRERWDIYRQIRAEKKTPILILSAGGKPEHSENSMDVNSDDFLTKPFKIRELTARLRTLIRQTTGTAGFVLHHRNLKLDTSKDTVTVADKHVRLTSVEYSMIKYLIMHSDRTISYAELHKHLFDEQGGGHPIPLNVHLYSLRSKLDIPYLKIRPGKECILENKHPLTSTNLIRSTAPEQKESIVHSSI